MKATDLKMEKRVLELQAQTEKAERAIEDIRKRERAIYDFMYFNLGISNKMKVDTLEKELNEVIATYKIEIYPK